MKSGLLLIIMVGFLFSGASGQGDSTITVSGIVYDADIPSRRLDDLMIINLATSNGMFGRSDGTFSITIGKNDTLLIASTGYETRRMTFSDSSSGGQVSVRIPIKRLQLQLKEVTIFSPRDLQSIYKEIEKLGYDKRDFQLSGVDALQSPITFLYQQFSRTERLKSRNAERVNNDRRRDLLKQLLANYVAYDIIDLEDRDFDKFIDFADVPEDYMKQASQYDFCMFIKHKYYAWTVMNGKRKF